MESMTGFGSAEYQDKHCKVSVALKSVNSKGLEIKTAITHELKSETLEEEVRTLLSPKVVRGNLYCSISLFSNDNPKVKKEEGIDFKRWKTYAKTSVKSLTRKTLQKPYSQRKKAYLSHSSSHR